MLRLYPENDGNPRSGFNPEGKVGAGLVTGSIGVLKRPLWKQNRGLQRTREEAGSQYLFIYTYIMGSYCVYCSVTCLFKNKKQTLCHIDLSHSA